MTKEKQLLKRPKFREVLAVKTIKLPDFNLSFNPKIVGPTDNFSELQLFDYGKNFRMATVPEIIPLIYASFENESYKKTAKKIIERFTYLFLGNTAILYTSLGIFVQDNPDLKKRKILMNRETLEGKLGKYAEKGVVFSKDRRLRFVPYIFKRGFQYLSMPEKNPGLIALVGGEENAEILTKISKDHHLEIDSWTLLKSEVGSSQIRVVTLGNFSLPDTRVGINATYLESEKDNDFSSFGVRMH